MEQGNGSPNGGCSLLSGWFERVCMHENVSGNHLGPLWSLLSIYQSFTYVRTTL